MLAMVSILFFSSTANAQYCTSEPTSNDGNGISNVQIAMTDFAGTDVTYLDFTGAPVDIQAGTLVNLQITYETGYSYDTNVWIDLGDDDSFAEAGDLVFSGESSSANPTTFNASFALDASAGLGIHRMRIGTADSGQATPNPCYSSTWGVTVDLDVNVTAAPSCLPPTDLAATNETPVGADLSWTENGTASLYNVEVVDAGSSPTGTATDSGVANGFTKSGLASNSSYDYYVQTDCTGGDLSGWSGPFTFTTTCDYILPEYNADMSVNVPDCWLEANSGDDTTGPMEVGAGLWYSSNHNGTPSNAINLFTDTRSDWIISPTFDLSTSAPSELRIYVALTENTTSGSDADLGSDDEVKLLMTLDNGTTWTTMQSWTQGNVPTDIGEEIVYDLSAVTGNVQFALLGDEGEVDDTEDVYFHISKFQVRETPSCIEPSMLMVSNVTSSTADLSWTAGATETMWNIELVDVTAGETVTGTATTTGVTNPYTLSGLTAVNSYEYYVQADCGGGDTSAWVGPMSFTTLCEPYTVNYTQNFDAESTPDVNTCWTAYVNGATSTFANVQTSSTQSVSASNSLRFYNSGDTSGEYYLVSPNFSDFDNAKRVKFSLYQNQGTTDEGDTVEIGTMTDPLDASTFTLVEAIPYADRTEDEWSEFTVNFDSYTGSDNYVAIKMTFGGAYNYYYFDDFLYAEIPSCLEPSALMVSDKTSTSANLSWTAGASETMWNIELVDLTAGETATGVATTTGVTNPLPLTGLTPNNNYEYYVQADCGGDTSIWVGPMAFYTGHCQPSGTSTATYIDSFTTTNGGSNISNTSSGLGTDNFEDNYENMTVSLAPGLTFDFSTTIVSGTVGTAIWVDWNNDLEFSTDEVEFTTSGYSGDQTGSITVPATVSNGEYRMRVMIDYNDSNPGNGDACSLAFGRGEVEDYKLLVDSSLSTQDFDNDSLFSYYPNPVNNTLSLQSQKEISNVSVFNMLGQEVFRNSPNTVNNDVDMSNLQSGAYFVKVTISGTTETIRVIKN